MIGVILGMDDDDDANTNQLGQPIQVDLGVIEVSKIDSSWDKSDSNSTSSRLGFA